MVQPEITKDQNPWIRKVVLSPPSLKDNTADVDRLAHALKQEFHTPSIGIDLSLARRIPSLLRAFNYQVSCVLSRHGDAWSLLDVKSLSDPSLIAGLAVDLGTTRVVLRLLNLADGSVLGETAFDNPQIEVGPDILTRIHFADTEKGLEKLNALIVNGLNEQIQRLCAGTGVEPKDIFALSLAGNTAMTHLFMGLPPRWIIREPYIPVMNRMGFPLAEDLGIHLHPRARALIFPNAGSYFGGDLIAGILYSGLNRREETSILVDVGTNAEVVVGNKNWMIACAGAAGPALEGGMSRMGMMAGPGVIDRVKIDPVSLEFRLHTIEEQKPVGICGSGVIDLAAQLFLSGMVDIRGRLAPDRCGSRLMEKNGMRHLIIVPARDSATGKDLGVSQADLDSLIRSKAAMYSILETVTMAVGVNFMDLDTFYVAGTFGSFINPVSAITIGMIPDLPLARYRSIGNSSLEGASMMLTGQGRVQEMEEIRDGITYMELNVNQEFMNRFSAAKFLPHTDPFRFPSVGRPPGA
jgi:uncharacterized 2Fe-2S/4Fe-4S cluster protein (DUF4445 family)